LFSKLLLQTILTNTTFKQIQNDKCNHNLLNYDHLLISIQISFIQIQYIHLHQTHKLIYEKL